METASRPMHTATHRLRLPGIVPILSILTALMGVVNLVSATFPALSSRLVLLEKFFPLSVRRGSHLTAALAGFALLVLANALSRRKRVAWLMATTILIISALSHMLKGLDYEEASLSALLAIILLINRHHFHAHSDSPSIRNGVKVLLLAVVFTLAYGATGFFLLDRHFKVSYNFVTAIRQSFVMFTQFYDPGLQPLTGFGRFFGDSVYMVAAGTFAYSIIMLIRPVLVREPASAHERARAQEIAERWGHTSLARFTFLPDKTLFFSPGGSLIAFMPAGRVALVLGDPIGPEGDLPATLATFKTYCVGNDWQAAFYQVQPDYLNIYRAAGFDAMMIGQEAVVNLAGFILEGKAGKEFRTVLNKMERLGHCVEIHQPPHTNEFIESLREVSDEWLTSMHGSEMRFSMGWFDDEYIRTTTVLTIMTPEGTISAFANIIPEYQRPQLAIDLMRRRSQVENGTMDFLIIALLRWAKEQGAESFSLGLSALSGFSEHSDNLAGERALHYIYENINIFYNFKGLHAFKEKFHPKWEPRYLVYPGLANLPLIGTALVRVNIGEDFPFSNLIFHPSG